MIAELATSGASLRAVAARYGVCEKTVRRWRDRAQALGSPTRLPDASSAPKHQPTRTSEAVEARIVALRRERRTYAQIRLVLPGVSMATLSRILRRHGLHRLAAPEPPRPPPVRYEYPAPGGLLHLDIIEAGPLRAARRARHGRAYRAQPGGRRGEPSCRHRRPQPGGLCLSAPRRKAAQRGRCAAPGGRLLRGPRRVDPARAHRPGRFLPLRVFVRTCRELGLKQLFTRPYRPQTHGKAERFIQTVTREWAYARSYDSSDQRASFLPAFLRDYNYHRPPSALNHLPPASRLPKTADNLLTYNS